jgi:hypothetical protein
MEYRDKRFMLFAYCDYYPSGGMSDANESYNSLAEAKEAIIKGSLNELDSCYVYDRIEGLTVFEPEHPKRTLSPEMEKLWYMGSFQSKVTSPMTQISMTLKNT